jgi:hypothetical protein
MHFAQNEWTGDQQVANSTMPSDMFQPPTEVKVLPLSQRFTQSETSSRSSAFSIATAVSRPHIPIITDLTTMKVLEASRGDGWFVPSELKRIELPVFPDRSRFGIDQIPELDVDNQEFRDFLWGYETDKTKTKDDFFKSLDNRTALKGIPVTRLSMYASKKWAPATVKGKICWPCWRADGKAYVKDRDCRRAEHPKA